MALEDVREQTGSHPCDRRSTHSELARLYPTVDFSQLVSDEDSWYTAEREPEANVDVRAARFLDWLHAREERVVAVVCHDCFLFHLFPLLEKVDGSGALQWQGKRFANCELRTVRLCVPAPATAPESSA